MDIGTLWETQDEDYVLWLETVLQRVDRIRQEAK